MDTSTMSQQDSQYTTMTDVNLIANTELFETDIAIDTFEDINFSDYVSDNDHTEFLSMLDEFAKVSESRCLSTTSSSTSSTEFLAQASDISVNNKTIISDGQSIGDEWEPDLCFISNEEIVATEDLPPNGNEIYLENDADHFALIDGSMAVKEQPKPDQRARYASDGKRFLPNAKKRPMSIQLPDLSSRPLINDETYGIIVTMVTTTDNPQTKTFVHVNDLRYHANDAIELGHGSTFVPLTRSDIKNCEKLLPRLSITCQKFDNYDFNLTSFDSSTVTRITQKYTVQNEETISKVAKGKQFTIEYNLLCYKIVCQLAFKEKHSIKISQIQCETNIVNEEKTAKRRATSNDRLSKRTKNSDYSTEASESIAVDTDSTSGNVHVLKPRAKRSKRSVKGDS